MLNLNKNDQNGYFYQGFGRKLWKKSGNPASNFARMATDATKREHYCECKHFPTLSLTWLSLAWPQCKQALTQARFLAHVDGLV